MADIVVIVRENNRRIVRGCTHDDKLGRTLVQVSEGETVKLTIDLTHWLGSATISSTSTTTDGGTVSVSESSGVLSVTASAISSMADTDITITVSDGRVRVQRLRFLRPESQQRDDYGSWVGW